MNPGIEVVMALCRMGFRFRMEGQAVKVRFAGQGHPDWAAVERKSFDDLIGCLTTGRERFEKELSRGRAYDLFCVVLEAALADVSQGRYRSETKPHAALQSIITFQVRYRIPFMWCGDRRGDGYEIHRRGCYRMVTKGR